MADVEMKDTSKPAGEEEKKQEEKKPEEPSDHFYGKYDAPLYFQQVLTSLMLTLYRVEKVIGDP